MTPEQATASHDARADRESAAYVEKVKAEIMLIAKQAAHFDTVADLAKNEKDRGRAAISIELKQIDNLKTELLQHLTKEA